jgi:hypothetical protein
MDLWLLGERTGHRLYAGTARAGRPDRHLILVDIPIDLDPVEYSRVCRQVATHSGLDGVPVVVRKGALGLLVRLVGQSVRRPAGEGVRP